MVIFGKQITQCLFYQQKYLPYCHFKFQCLIFINLSKPENLIKMLDVNKKDKIPEAYPEPSQTCKMDRFGKIAED